MGGMTFLFCFYVIGFNALSFVVPKPPSVVFGPQLIYKWALSQSYQLSSKLHLDNPN